MVLPLAKPGPVVAVREAGSAWERLLGVPEETWILRQEFTGNLLCLAMRLEKGSTTWATKVYLPDNVAVEGVAIGSPTGIPSVFEEAERMLADAGIQFQPTRIVS